MRLTNALVLVLTFVLALFAFFSSYIALHHQQYESDARNNANPTGNHVGEGDARHHALQFSRGVGGFNLTKIKAAARNEISYLQAGMKEAVLHVTSGITTTTSVNKDEGIKTSTNPAAATVVTGTSHKTSPRAVKEAYLSRMANRTGNHPTPFLPFSISLVLSHMLTILILFLPRHCFPVRYYAELANRYEKQMHDKQLLLEKQRQEEIAALRNQVESLKGNTCPAPILYHIMPTWSLILLYHGNHRVPHSSTQVQWNKRKPRQENEKHQILPLQQQHHQRHQQQQHQQQAFVHERHRLPPGPP